MNNNKILVSIIIPVYNVEKYIVKCATTLFEQDFDSIEYIFVNDCSPDNSMQVLQSVIEKYPNRKNDIKIINKPQNEGLGQARKTGFESATGEYILHIDSDDWVELDMASSLYKKAKEDDADIVCCDYFINFKNKEIYKRINFDKEDDVLKAYLLEFIDPYLWTKFVKKSLYKNLIFPKFSLAEDRYIGAQLFYNAEKVAYISHAFVHYNRTNLQSLVSSFGDKQLGEMNMYYNSMIEFLKSKNIYDKYIEYLRIQLNGNLLTIMNKDYLKNLRKIDDKLVDIDLVIKNPSLSKLQKLSRALIFLGFEKVFDNLKRIYRKIKY